MRSSILIYLGASLSEHYILRSLAIHGIQCNTKTYVEMQEILYYSNLKIITHDSDKIIHAKYA